MVTIESVSNKFINEPGFFLGRLGNVETTCLMTEQEGQMRTNAGLYGDEDELTRFRKLFAESIFATDALMRVYTCPSFRICDELLVRLGVWRPTIPYFEYAGFYLQILQFLTQNDSKVAIVSHFSEEIKKQLAVLKEVWGGKWDIKTENIVVIHSYNTVYERPHSGYTETLKDLTDRCLDADASHYFLSCGAYGMPLGANLSRHKKNAIYVGGIMQTMFGIMGARWDTRPEIAKFMNTHWIYPDPNKYAKLKSIEGGCYL
jgi:hypothetical protein